MEIARRSAVKVALAIGATGLVAAPATAANPLGTIKTGKLHGKLIVQWLEPDLFMFLPDKASPLTFSRANGASITPGKMITDGGSIPRSLWILRSYSPWGFAPAFIVHDWLFNVKHCNIAGYNVADVDEAAKVMAEVMKTMVTEKLVDASDLTILSMYEAVRSPVARELWSTGACNPPPAGMNEISPISQYELSYDTNAAKS